MTGAEKTKVENASTVDAVHLDIKPSNFLPAASELAEYEKVVPGSADRILAMAEAQAEQDVRLRNEKLEFEKTLGHWKLGVGVATGLGPLAIVALGIAGPIGLPLMLAGLAAFATAAVASRFDDTDADDQQSIEKK